eukprot:jgi/Tetstr1/445496/TSEL_033272.t1
MLLSQTSSCDCMVNVMATPTARSHGLTHLKTPCVRLGALRRAFADKLDPVGRVRAMSAYKEARAKCNWTSTPATVTISSRSLAGSGRKLAYTGEELGSWRIVRVGPFQTASGDWNNFNSFDIGNFSKELAQGSPLWLTGLSLQIITADGTPLPSPPLHLHHAQLTPSSTWNVTHETRHGVASYTWQRRHGIVVLNEWAGDTQCKEAEGGVDCLMLTFPDGFGVGPIAPRSGGLALDFITVDVRPEGSEDLEFYVELARAGWGSGPLDLSNWRGAEVVELEKVGYSIGGAQAYLLKNRVDEL